MKACHRCGAPWQEKFEPGRADTCLQCGADMHGCRNCRFYDVTKARQCASMTTDPPSDKEAANMCDEFLLADRAAAAVPSSDERKKALEEKWKNLFKD